MNTRYLLLLLVSCLLYTCNSNKTIISSDSSMKKTGMDEIDMKVDALLSKMTLEEKAGQLNQLNGGQFTGPALRDPGQQAKMQDVRDGNVGSFLNVVGAENTRAIQKIAVEESRLGIPIIFAYDVIHGYKTIFPIPLAEACSWDLSEIEKNTRVAARETAAAGLHWTFAPNCDISNDPRWGRVMEAAGEDPYLGSLIAEARVKGFQGDLKGVDDVLACIKHYAAYGAVEGGREYNTVDISRVVLHNKFMPPYKAAVDAGAATVMNGFNVFEGVPVSGSKYLVKDILIDKWGFDGFIVSDWASFNEMKAHGYALDDKDVALKALQAGSMMDMESRASYKHLPTLIREGKISEAMLNNAVGKILYYKFKIGLFDDPYKFSDTEREAASMLTAENRAQARKAGRNSIVLLKNDGILPIKEEMKKIALIGYYANSREDMFDFWVAQGSEDDAVTLKEGLEKRYGDNTQISYADGYQKDGTTTAELINQAVALAEEADVVLLNIGISGDMAGEDRALADINIPEGQVELLKALNATGKPIASIICSGRPLVLTDIEPLSNSILQTWILGTEHGNSVADIVSGDFYPTGKTVMSFPYAVGQIPVYYNHLNTGRPLPEGGGAWLSRYRDIPNDPLYAFGHGLGYTSFEHSEITSTSNTVARGGSITFSTTVKNVGLSEGVEIVQLYIRDKTASIVRPVKELKAFKRVTLGAGETRKIEFNLVPESDFTFFDSDGNSVLENGEFDIFIGGSSETKVMKTIKLQ